MIGHVIWKVEVEILGTRNDEFGREGFGKIDILLTWKEDFFFFF